jgi:hypothetical protein
VFGVVQCVSILGFVLLDQVGPDLRVLALAIGFYMEAYLKIYKISGISFVERQLIGFEDEMTNHCVGSLPELFDGNPPFKGRGAVSFAMNVAEMLRILKLLSKYNF